MANGWYDVFPSPLGPIFAGGSAEGLHRIDFMDGEDAHERFVARLERDAGGTPVHDAAAAQAVREQIEAYFAGERFAFDLPLAARGTPFQQAVWDALCTIEPGRTASYGEIAARIGHPTASRAVGAANGRNPLTLVVPCHRVIGATGRLTGYASGVDRKRWLLDHEARAMPLFAAPSV